ncbi:MAG: NADH-quinone oxidoreductase subunit C [Proteobacteria bacterium]|nr:NADH-quinone oxidoreductase subunit C [Pseudomonadota bacterium]
MNAHPFATLPGLATLPGALRARHGTAHREHLPQLCQAVADAGGHLLALWGSDERDRGKGFTLSLALHDGADLVVVEAALDAEDPHHPDLSAILPAAARMQRANCDLTGIRADGGDPRGWLDHGHWSGSAFPLRRLPEAMPAATADPADYAFVRVAGSGVHEIAVGPVHAGVIEPGHFRFSVVGEKLLRLEERLGYTHKGIERRFQDLTLAQGAPLAARICGDSTIAFAWAWAMAVEALTGTAPPPRALALRALLLERERLANHLGDLGALGNDGGFAFGLSQFMRLKEDLLRSNAAAFGARYLLDALAPGGTRVDLSEDARARLLGEVAPLEAQLRTLRAIYDDHAGLQDRFIGAGRASPELVARLGGIGLAARASGARRDWRVDLPVAPYDCLDVRVASRSDGDVAARVAVRFDEAFESLRLCRILLEILPTGPVTAAVGPVLAEGLALGGVEGWRGPVLLALRADPDGRIRRCHPHDPSWQNWPLIEHAALPDIVADFPLINKSFNLSYSGHDL